MQPDHVAIEMEPMSIPPHVEEPPEPKHCCWGRVFHHWTQYPIAIADGVIAAPTIYGWVTGMALVWPICGSVAVVGLTVAFVSIGCLTPRRDLEKEVEHFRNEANRMATEYQSLSGKVIELEKVKNDLEKDLQEAKSTVVDLANMFKQDIIDFSKTAEGIETAQQQANNLLDLYKQFKEMFLALRKMNNESSRMNKVFRDQIHQLGGTVQTLDKHEDQFSQGVDKLGAQVEAIGGRLPAFKQFEERLRQDVKEMSQQVDTFAEKVTEAKKLKEALDKIDKE